NRRNQAGGQSDSGPNPNCTRESFIRRRSSAVSGRWRYRYSKRTRGMLMPIPTLFTTTTKGTARPIGHNPLAAVSGEVLQPNGEVEDIPHARVVRVAPRSPVHQQAG